MPSRDDYAMICYGFYKDFETEQDAYNWTDELINSDCLWKEQYTKTSDRKSRVYIYLKSTQHSVGSRTGTFNTEFQLETTNLPIFKNDCKWHLVMWGPHY